MSETADMKKIKSSIAGHFGTNVFKDSEVDSQEKTDASKDVVDTQENIDNSAADVNENTEQQTEGNPETQEKQTVTDTTEAAQDQPLKDVETETDVKSDEAKTTDYNKLVQERTGYNSVEDLLNGDAPDKIKNFDALKNDYEQLKLENEELLKEASSLNNPFAREDSFYLNHLLSENPDLDIVSASKLLNIKTENLSSIEKIKLAMQIENPEFSDKHIERNLVKKFDVDSFADLNSSDLDDDIKLDIDIAAKKALKSLDKFKIPSDLKYDGTFIPEKIKERVNKIQAEAETSEQEIERTWLPVSDQIKNTFKELTVPVFDKKGNVVQNAYTKFVLSDSDRQAVASEFMNIMKQSKVKEMTPELKQFMDKHIFMQAYMRKLPQINALIVEKATNDEFARVKAMRDGVGDQNKKKEVSDKGASVVNSPQKLLEGIGNAARRTHWRDVGK